MIMFGAFLGFLVLGMPIGLTMIVIGLAYFLLQGTVDPIIVAQRVATGVDSSALLALPFYIVAGELMNTAGLTERIFRFAKVVVGRVRGALGYVGVIASMIFAGMSGSAVADAAGVGKIGMRAMLQEGYDRDHSAALLAAASTIGPIIPPSISFVVYALISGVSIGGMFMAGFLPGVLMGVTLMVAWFFHSRKMKYPVSQVRYSAKEFWAIFLDAFWSLLMPILVVGGIIGGVFTATEAGAFAVLYALILGLFVYKEMKWQDLPQIFYNCALQSGNTLIIIAASAVISWILTMNMVPQAMTTWVMTYAASKFLFLLLINILFLVIGCFMAAQPALIMIAPVLLPSALALGIHPIHFGVIIVLNLMIGLLTPPVGFCLYILSDIAEVPLNRLVKALVPSFIALLVALIMTTYWGDMVMWLPRTFGIQ